LSWTGPFLELYPDLQLEEAVRLHFRFKRCLLAGPRACLAALYLEQHRGKKLAYFSSGMLQRLKLGMALFSDSSLLLLDEPTSFMDPQNTQFALQLLADYRKGRTLVLASNIPAEYQRFARQLQLTQAAG
jgi:ABC-type multidrug transport system ATPase subunit